MPAKKLESTPATRWTLELARRGYTPIVKAFVEHAGRRGGRKGGGLGLNPTQMMIVIQLMSFKRDIRMPFPAIKTIAARLGLSDTTVRTNLSALARRALIVKHMERGSTTSYDLSPLFRRLETLQAEAEARKATDKAEADAKQFPSYYAEDEADSTAPSASPSPV